MDQRGCGGTKGIRGKARKADGWKDVPDCGLHLVGIRSTDDEDLLYPSQRKTLKSPIQKSCIAYRQQALEYDATNYHQNPVLREERGTDPGLAYSQRFEAFVETVRENDSLEDFVLLCDVLFFPG